MHGDPEMQYVGTVTHDPDDEYAEEDGNVIVNTDEPEKQPEREEVNAQVQTISRRGSSC